jgi:hypothetical protein
VVPLIAPGALALLFLCLLPTWVGTYFLEDTEPYTQSGWGMGFGGQFSGTGLLYLLLLLPTLLIAWANLLVPVLGVHVPPQVKHLWPHRLPVLVVATAVLLLLLLFQMVTGFGLEKAIEKPPTESVKETKASSEDRLAKGLSQGAKGEGARFARLSAYRTFWVWWAFLLQIVVLVGVLLEFWLDRRGSRPLPKMDIAW